MAPLRQNTHCQCVCQPAATPLKRLRMSSTEAAQEGKREERARKQVTEIMRDALGTLPLYVWLVALPQLTSRICHPHAGTQKLTQHILTRVTQAFPHQARLPRPMRSFRLQRHTCPSLAGLWIP